MSVLKNQENEKVYTSRTPRFFNNLECVPDWIAEFYDPDLFYQGVSDEITFFLERNRTNRVILNKKTKTLNRSGFNKSAKTVFITHGWLMSSNNISVTKIRNGESIITHTQN